MNFDLNIENYTPKELEIVFKLPLNYDKNTLEINTDNLIKKLLNSTQTLDNNSKREILNFIKKGNSILKENIKDELTQVYNNVYNLDQNLSTSDTVAAGGTNVIKQPITPYIQTQTSEFYQGNINPLNKRTIRQNLNIDTRFRENYYGTLSTNFQFNLPIKLTNVLSMQLTSIELPTTFYVISKIYGNNFFQIILPNLNKSLMVIVPDGNYDYLELQNYINNFLETQPDIDFQDINFFVDLNVNALGKTNGSGKMIVGSKSGTTIFSLNFLTDILGNDERIAPLPLRLGWLLGFRVGYYENSLTYVSEGVVNIIGPRYLYLVIDDYNNSVNDGFYGAFSSSLLNKNILARIVIISPTYYVLSQNNLNLITTPRDYFGPVNIQKINIQLLDEYGRILDLNNMDYSFCLAFQTIYNL